MKKLGICLLLCASSLLFSGCTNETAQMRDTRVNMDAGLISTTNDLDATTMLEKVRGAVVGISVELSNGYAVGSGVALHDGGYVLTNHHVVNGGKSVNLYYADKTTGAATVLWKDSALDLAILKADRNLPYLGINPSKNVNVGQEVYALGTPLTLQFRNTVTKGIISAKERTLEVQGEAGSSFLQSLVQHDASINPGNSGGPLIDRNGNVVGINTLKASEGEGIGFAIPIEIAYSIIERVAENNSYKAPYLGIFGFDSDIATIYGESGLKHGVYVISTDGPSKEAGITKGDVIVSLNNMQINTMLDLRIALYTLNAGDKVSIEYIRNSKKEIAEMKAIKR